MNYDTVWLLSTLDVLTNLVTTLLKPPITTPHAMKRAPVSYTHLRAHET